MRISVSKTDSRRSFLLDYINGTVTWEEAREHIKVEEQKWIRKAKKFSLYEDQPYRIK